MFGIRWSGFQGRLVALVAVVVAGLVAVGGTLYTALATVKIDGALYRQIGQHQDLVNDLIPPTLYVRTPYLLTLQMVAETDPREVRDLVVDFRRAEADYTDRYAYWQRTLPDGQLKDALRTDIDAVAAEFFVVCNRDLLPAVEAGPAGRDKAAALVRGPLRALFLRQKVGTERVTRLTTEAKSQAEATGRDAVRFWTITSVVVFAAVLGVVVLAGWAFTRAIVRPTNALVTALKGMVTGAGDLTARVTVKSADEIGDLGHAINAVLQNLHDLVVSVRESSIRLYASSTDFAATSRSQETTMQSLGASTSQIAAAVKEISATTAELAGTMNTVHEGGKQTGALARAGRAGLNTMGSTMTRLAEGTNSISGKLSAVREKANDINAVVTTITKVADQTNLLSINAAIEAEKAGDSGRGFLVVAREIRRLADQTAVATLDIETMVRHMQGAVTAGVMEMDKFTDEVRSGVTKVGEINSQMGQIIEQVYALNEQFQAVNEAMAQQSGGSRQINDAMLTLVNGVQDTSASLREFHAVTVKLRESADGLRTQVEKFKVVG